MGKQYSGNLNKNEMKMVKQNAPKPRNGKTYMDRRRKLGGDQAYFRSLAFSKK